MKDANQVKGINIKIKIEASVMIVSVSLNSM